MKRAKVTEVLKSNGFNLGESMILSAKERTDAENELSEATNTVEGYRE